MTGGNRVERVQEVRGSSDPNSLPVAHAGDKERVGKQGRCSLEEMASQAVEEGCSHSISPTGISITITNLAKGNPKEG